MIRVKAHQSLLDVSIEHCGSIEPLVEISTLNSISVTDDLAIGHALNMPPVYDEKTATLFGNLHNKPATALNDTDMLLIRQLESDEEMVRIFDNTFDKTYE